MGTWGFESWRQSRNMKCADSISAITEMTTTELDTYLTRFVMEARKVDGGEYQPRSLYLLSCGLLRHLRDNKVYDKNFFDTTRLEFTGFRSALDARMKQLLSKGYGTKPKQAQPLSVEEEKSLWDKGVFGADTSESLQHTVFFYACKLFGLRGKDEHHDLQCEQFTVGEDHKGKFVEFAGRGSKTYKGGLKQLQLTNKNLKHYCRSDGTRCIADYFDQYLDLMGRRGKFYRRALCNMRYGEQPIGVNKLGVFMKNICMKGNLVGNFTNHSGKRTCATQLYNAGVAEQEIMTRTGHRSERGVRKYKESCTEVLQKVSAVLDPPSSPHTSTATSSPPAKKVKFNDNQWLHEMRPVFSNCQVSFNFK